MKITVVGAVLIVAAIVVGVFVISAIAQADNRLLRNRTYVPKQDEYPEHDASGDVSLSDPNWFEVP